MDNLPENPFMPDRPVQVGSFVGRQEQVEQFLDIVKSASRGRLRIGYISGERGIGKSSLAKMASHIAERDLPIACAHIHLGGVTDLKGLARQILTAFAENSENKSWMRTAKDMLKRYIQSVDIFGVNISLQMPDEDLRSVADNFSSHITTLLQNLDNSYRAMLLILDDINGLAESAEFSHWLKNMMDRVATSGQAEPPLCLLVIGLEERRRQMIKLNPSVGRALHPTIFIDLWKGEEAIDFFRRHFKALAEYIPPQKAPARKAPDKNDISDISWEEVYNTCARFSGNFPMIAQQIGYSVWNCIKSGATPDISKLNIHDALLNGIANAADKVG